MSTIPDLRLRANGNGELIDGNQVDNGLVTSVHCAESDEGEGTEDAQEKTPQKSLMERLREGGHFESRVTDAKQKEDVVTRAASLSSADNTNRTSSQKVTAGHGRSQLYKKPRKSSNPQGREDPLHDPQLLVPVFAVKATEGGVPAFLFSQLLYWRSTPRYGDLPRMKPQPMRGQNELPDEDEWAWGEGYAEMGRQIAASYGQIRRAVDACFEAGLLAELDGEGHVAPVKDGRHLQRGLLRIHPKVLHWLKEMGELDGTSKLRRVLVPRSFIQITRNHNQALILEVICWWCKKNSDGQSKLRIHREDHSWRSNSYKLLARETGLNEDQVEYALKRLRKRKFIETRQWQSAFEQRRLCKTVHVRPLEKNIRKAQQKARE